MKYRSKYPLVSATVEQELNQVECMAEAARVLGITYRELARAVDNGWVAWKKSGNVYLISMPSARRWLALKR